jgi:hypothetical protein
VRVQDGKYQCVVCSAIVDVPVDKEPSVVIKAASGTPNVRTIVCDGRELHACEVSEPRSSLGRD